MHHRLALIAILCLTSTLAACDYQDAPSGSTKGSSSARVRSDMPEKGQLDYRDTVLVENDGRCEDGQVIKVTGGSRKRNIPRQYECVARP